MGEEYDVPWEYVRRGGAARLSSMRASVNEGGMAKLVSTPSADCISSSSNNSLRGGYPADEAFRPSSSTEGASRDGMGSEGRRRSSRGERREEEGRREGRREEEERGEEGGGGRRRVRRIDESCIQTDMDRVEAEKRLGERATGDFILRWRDDGISAALSLRAHEGVLHLKIERIQNRWIVGEGARFRSISQAISFYRKNPLPIRGAKHVCLLECLSCPPVAEHRRL